MRLITVCLLAGVGVISVGGSTGWAQMCQQYVPNPAPNYTDEKAELFVAKHVPHDTSNIECQVPTNGWVRKNNIADNSNSPPVYDNDGYRIHLKVLTSGGCKQQYWDFWWGCQEVPSSQTYRSIGGSPIEKLSPSYSYVGPVQPNNFFNIQTLDTRNQTGTASTGLSVQFLDEGSYSFKSDTPLGVTSCSFSPSNREALFTVNVLECKPEWYVNVAGTLNYHGPATGPIVIAVPPGFSGALGAAKAAASDWAAALGRDITAVETTCTAGDELCIELDDDHGTVEDDPEGCASLGPASYDTNGVWTGRTRVRFEPNWKGAHADSLRWTIAHELGHYFGLWNRQDGSCGYDTTLMKGGNCYGTSAPPAGTALGPTASDVSALVNSTYGSQGRSICGW
jgi:hypothetical protein